MKGLRIRNHSIVGFPRALDQPSIYPRERSNTGKEGGRFTKIYSERVPVSSGVQNSSYGARGQTEILTSRLTVQT